MKAATLDCPDSFPDGLDAIATPAFVYDERAIHRLLDCAGPVRRERRCQLLFAIKSLDITPLRMSRFAEGDLNLPGYGFRVLV